VLPDVSGEFRVGADPDLRFAPSGVAVTKIRAVASSRKKQDDGSWVDDKTCWVNLVGFKKVAENMAESFQKGDLVIVNGRLQVEEWEDNDGNKRTSVDIIVNNMGPSVSFNPARPVRTERASNSGGGGGNSNSTWETPPQSDEPPF